MEGRVIIVNTVKNKILIGITGVIASGKSLVVSYLKNLQYEVIDADQVNRDLLKEEGHILAINRFLFEKEDSYLDKKAVRDLIFNDKEKRKQLEEYLHPLIYQEIKKRISESVKSIVFVEVALLYEANYHFFDHVICVYVPYDDIVKRLSKRDNISIENAKKMIATQMDIEEKCQRSDFCIDNTKEKEYTYIQVDEVLNTLRRKYGNL